MEECDMKWIPDDSYLEKIEGRSRVIKGGGKKLPRWFWIDWLRPKLKSFRWHFFLIFGANKQVAATGYRLGFVNNGHAFVGDMVLNHETAVIRLSNAYDWIFFLVDPQGKVLDCLNNNQEGYIDASPVNKMDSYADGRPSVD
jgi:hypothetical protein